MPGSGPTFPSTPAFCWGSPVSGMGSPWPCRALNLSDLAIGKLAPPLPSAGGEVRKISLFDIIPATQEQHEKQQQRQMHEHQQHQHHHHQQQQQILQNELSMPTMGGSSMDWTPWTSHDTILHLDGAVVQSTHGSQQGGTSQGFGLASTQPSQYIQPPASQSMFGAYGGEQEDMSSMFFPGMMDIGAGMAAHMSDMSFWTTGIIEEQAATAPACFVGTGVATSLPAPPNVKVVTISADLFPEPSPEVMAQAVSRSSCVAATQTDPTSPQASMAEAIFPARTEKKESPKEDEEEQATSGRSGRTRRGGRRGGGAAAAAAAAAAMVDSVLEDAAPAARHEVASPIGDDAAPHNSGRSRRHRGGRR